MNENDKDLFPEDSSSEKEELQNTENNESISNAQSPDNTQAAEPEQTTEPEQAPAVDIASAKQAFSWEFTPPEQNNAEQSPTPSKKKPRSGVKFAIIMAIVFGIAFVGLVLSLIFDYTFPFTDDNVVEENESADITISNTNTEGYEHNWASSEELEDFKYSVVVIETTKKNGTNSSKSTGTGIILDSNGYIITNQHVIDGADTVRVTLYDGETLEAKIVGESPRNDIAVIKVDYDYLFPAVFGKSDSVVLGQRVYAVGTPKNIDFGWTVTEGIISCVDREVKIYNDSGILDKTMNMIQTDAPLNSGNSGGPIINSDCQVIGIVTMKLTDTEGIGFAIPIDGALEIAQEIIKNGSTDGSNSSVSTGRPLIGISGVGVKGKTWYTSYGDSFAVVTKEFAENNPNNSFYAAVDGVYVLTVSEGFDAEDKIQVKDIITEIDGIEVTSIYDIVNHIGELEAGDSVHLTVYRGSEYIETDVVLEMDK